MPEVIIIKLTDGEERETAILPDESWSCPYCGSPNIPGTATYDERPWPYPCGNPACIAGGQGALPNVLAIKKRWADEKEAKEARHRLELSNERARTEREQAAQAAQMAFRQEAADHGFCMDCWNHSTDYGRFLRHATKVKHREPGNCPELRKRQRARS